MSSVLNISKCKDYFFEISKGLEREGLYSVSQRREKLVTCVTSLRDKISEYVDALASEIFDECISKIGFSGRTFQIYLTSLAISIKYLYDLDNPEFNGDVIIYLTQRLFKAVLGITISRDEMRSFESECLKILEWRLEPLAQRAKVAFENQQMFEELVKAVNASSRRG